MKTFVFNGMLYFTVATWLGGVGSGTLFETGGKDFR